MVKTFDSEVKSTRKYAKILLVIAVVFALVIGSFVIYSCVYFNTKNKFKGELPQRLKENNFHKNRNGYYSMSDSKGITYSVQINPCRDYWTFLCSFILVMYTVKLILKILLWKMCGKITMNSLLQQFLKMIIK